jgi:hypothetical protein
MSQTDISPSVTQICKKCGVEKPLSDYGNSSARKSGKDTKCLECRRAESREYHHKNKEKKKEAYLRWRANNREYHNNYVRNRRSPDSDFKPIRETKPLDREGHLSRRREKRKIRRANDPIFRVVENMRARVSGAVKAAQAKKSDKSIRLIGCTNGQFKNWIESHFESGMTWGNYGRGEGYWNIDHHFPCASFDLLQEKEQRKCFHYTNLYPMWQKQNSSKSDDVPLSPRTPEQEAFLKSHE